MTFRHARPRAAGGALVVAFAALGTMAARAQPFPVERARTLVAGKPVGARMDRVDGARTGLSVTPLPTAGLRIEWRAAAGADVDDEPLVDARGGTYVVGARGEVLALARDGSERWRVPTGALDPGPAALLSDDTLVFADATGDAIGVREGGVRWRSHFGRADAAHPPPLPLDDGGVVMATTRDLVVLDAQGRPRGRTVLPEPTTAPLLSALGQVFAVTASGAIWGWVPGALEASRLGSFGSPIEGGAALANEHTLVAIAAGQTTLSAVDFLRGGSTGGGGPSVTRAVAPGGLWLGPPAMRGEAATLGMLGATSELVITVDGVGRELGRAVLVGHAPPGRVDAGSAQPAASAVSGMPLLVDAAGTVAFATLEGSVGVAVLGAGGDGSVELLSDACPRAPGPTSLIGTVAGLAPLPPQSFVAICRSGTILAVSGSHPATGR